MGRSYSEDLDSVEVVDETVRIIGDKTHLEHAIVEQNVVAGGVRR
ncbi:hypothetical protein DFP91_2998 [Pseudorhodoplanes sinuspersici]|nr:hypothetical protein DFP91_2998 [Pseudorhodoplanes sinuspersici]